MDMQSVHALVGEDFSKTNQLILEELRSQVPLITEIGNYLVQNGGKRLRPLLSLLCARAIGYSGSEHCLIAAMIEFIHSATLLHDDVVDESDVRRGKPSANAAFGNSASVLTGDFLYSRAFQMMVRTGNLSVLEIMAETTNKISEGEVLQLLNCKDAGVDEARYFDVIFHKTGKLFQASCELAAVIHQQENWRPMFREYGRYVGNAFQIVDDVFDYVGDEATIGKKPGDDLREGNPTLPLIYAMKHSSVEKVALIAEAICKGSDENFAEIARIVQHEGGLEYCYRRAQEEAEKAKISLAPLPESSFKEALISLCDIAVSREH